MAAEASGRAGRCGGLARVLAGTAFVLALAVLAWYGRQRHVPDIRGLQPVGPFSRRAGPASPLPDRRQVLQDPEHAAATGSSGCAVVNSAVAFSKPSDTVPDPDQLRPVSLAVFITPGDSSPITATHPLAGRQRTAERAVWQPQPWLQVGAPIRSGNLSAVVQEAVRDATWEQGGAIVVGLVDHGSEAGAHRSAASFGGAGAAGAAVLEVWFYDRCNEANDTAMPSECLSPPPP
eukprot:CAMPEP_0182876250 /NCGR_PEP_ID=MMETSP0034_2-20130328/14036_1 /TAXON_ID=156128 /ORGANISM="Nephroselmis pyriformis, Strain CCMP717" /LENGTH=233 /DNA_ID=CAMNT_0025009025 /DNA_START=66 /DNA_END=763 /DNA_ORIENTATION=+